MYTYIICILYIHQGHPEGSDERVELLQFALNGVVVALGDRGAQKLRVEEFYEKFHLRGSLSYDERERALG